MRAFLALLCLVAGCHGSSTPAPATTAAPTAAAAPAPTALSRPLAMQVNGTLLHFRTAGTIGTAVVFIHDSYGDLDDWSAQVPAFARTHRVLVYSRRYHPPNPPQPDGQVYSPQLHAQDLAALLQGVGLGPAQVVGSGYGAYVALMLALQHPDLVRTLVLSEPPIIPFLLRTPAGDSLRRAFFATSLDPARAAFERGDSVRALGLVFDGLGLPAAARARILAHSFEVRREVLADRQQYLPPLDCGRLGRLAMPALLLQGDRSARMFHIITGELAYCLQTDTVLTIPGAGHGMQTENPAYYNQTVLQYLATH